MLTRIVRTGLSSTVSTPAMPPQWTMCVAPRGEPRSARSASRTSPWRKLKFGCSASSVPRERVAVEVVERDDVVVVDEPAGERRPDEAGAAGDEDALAAQRHAGESSARVRRPRRRRPSAPILRDTVHRLAFARRRRQQQQHLPALGVARRAIDIRIAYRATDAAAPKRLELHCDAARARHRAGPDDAPAGS